MGLSFVILGYNILNTIIQSRLQKTCLIRHLGLSLGMEIVPQIYIVFRHLVFFLFSLNDGYYN